LSSHGIFLGPGSGCFFVTGSLVLVDVSNLRDERIVWVRVSEKRADGKENLGYGQGRAPLLLEDVEADAAV